jgi:hypothetical protein
MGAAVTGDPGLSEETVAAMTAAALREAAVLLTEVRWTTGSIDVHVAGTEPASLPPALGEHFDATSRKVMVTLDDAGPRLGWFRHQLAHALLRERHPRVPPWVDEGFARSMEAPSGFLPMHLLGRLRHAPDPDGWYRDAQEFSFATVDRGGRRSLACHALFASLGVPSWNGCRAEPAATTLAHWERRDWQTDGSDLERLQQLARWLAANPGDALLRARLRSPRLELYEIVELADVEPGLDLPLADAIDLASRAVEEHLQDDTVGWTIRGLFGALCDYSLRRDDAHEVLVWVRARLHGHALAAFEAEHDPEGRRVIATWRAGVNTRSRLRLRHVVPTARLRILGTWAQALADIPASSPLWTEWLAAVCDLCPDRRREPIDRLCMRPEMPPEFLQLALRAVAARSWRRDEVADVIGFPDWRSLARAPGPRWWSPLHAGLLAAVGAGRG